MSILFWALTFGVIGKILLAVGILKVHYVMSQEKRIDSEVIHSFHYEKILTLIGIGFIVTGYLMELYFYNGLHMLSCTGGECAASVLDAIAP
ncbi:hypothetical protein K2Q16_01695 [Patescibacteria group bacterium]|nr:hypothetical protein [Patescibacteria group bacterium]